MSMIPCAQDSQPSSGSGGCDIDVATARGEVASASSRPATGIQKACTIALLNAADIAFEVPLSPASKASPHASMVCDDPSLALTRSNATRSTTLSMRSPSAPVKQAAFRTITRGRTQSFCLARMGARRFSRSSIERYLYCSSSLVCRLAIPERDSSSVTLLIAR